MKRKNKLNNWAPRSGRPLSRVAAHELGHVITHITTERYFNWVWIAGVSKGWDGNYDLTKVAGCVQQRSAQCGTGSSACLRRRRQQAHNATTAARGKPDAHKRRIQMDKVKWGQLEKKYNIVVEGNKAAAARRGQLFGKLLTATATLGTKAVELKLWTGIEVAQFDADHTEKFTESNLAGELKNVCLFTLAQWEMAQAQVAAGA
jgi:hypothetical protein